MLKRWQACWRFRALVLDFSSLIGGMCSMKENTAHPTTHAPIRTQEGHFDTRLALALLIVDFDAASQPLPITNCNIKSAQNTCPIPYCLSPNIGLRIFQRTECYWQTIGRISRLKATSFVRFQFEVSPAFDFFGILG